MERMFELNNISDTKRSKHAISKLIGYASSWWEKEKWAKNRNGDIAIDSWGFLRVVMRARFVPEDYVNDLLTKFYNMKQGNMNVKDYFKELETTRVRANLDDNGRLMISRFLVGFKHEISIQMTLQKIVTIHEALQGAIKVENKLQEERCYKCQGYGHKISECPNKRTIILMKEAYEREESRESCEEEEAKCDDEVEYDTRNLPFCANVASASMVDKLNLKTQRHTHPYKLQWLNECGELKVNRQVLVSFKTGKSFEEKLNVSLQEITPSEVTEYTLAQSEDYSILQGGKIESLEVHQGMIAKLNTLSSCDEHSDVSSVSLGTFIDSNDSLSCEDTLDSDPSFFDSLNDLFAYEEALI
ncbi:uncharacterized protein [Nicotiana tomentosiformis]|uniref:uncharacterized protein n=1 Tax=Nicotiana tomentosiformis TaxID=4098 RepID=UPI00388CD66A